MNGLRKVALAGLLCGWVGTSVVGDPAVAQDQGSRPPGSSNAAPGRPVPQPKTGAPAAPRAAPAEAAPRTDAQLRQRVEELEKEIVDMHVLVGTLETLARQGGGGGAPPGGGGGFSVPLTGAEASRISALETQVQALTIQIEQLTAQIRAMGGSGGVGDGRRPAPGGFQKSNPAAGGGFGSTVVTPGGGGGGDPIGEIISGGGGGSSGGGRQVAMGPGGAGAGSGAAKVAYEAAYAQLLQQDYDGAEAGFREFLQLYPTDSMAANAQYWLAETYYLRGRFDAASQAFLAVVQKHGNSLKAPDSLAKLAMSLDRSGKRPAACAALGELNKRFPNPPAHVKNWEQAERRRTGCT